MLKRSGADPFKARLILRESLDDIKTKSNLVNSAQIIANHFAIAALATETQDRPRPTREDRRTNSSKSTTSSPAFAIGNIGDDVIAISARSVDKFNVQLIMEQFGGGGHLNNAAAQIQERLDSRHRREKLETILKQSYKEEINMKVILASKTSRAEARRATSSKSPTATATSCSRRSKRIEAVHVRISSRLEEERAKAENEAKAELENAKKLKADIGRTTQSSSTSRSASPASFSAPSRPKQIAEEYKKTHNIDVDKRKIVLDDNIHSLGVYKVPVKLHKDVTATINLQIHRRK
ncbi:MAG: DHHA1 domain-containing protein [Bacillus subtilis]|nr:DHHA1 domain-containing protein [Bacillus subtilis]